MNNSNREYIHKDNNNITDEPVLDNDVPDKYAEQVSLRPPIEPRLRISTKNH